METSIPDIYAVGDAVQVKHYVTGQGRSVIKVFDMTAATTGINETNARKSGLDVDMALRRTTLPVVSGSTMR